MKRALIVLLSMALAWGLCGCSRESEGAFESGSGQTITHEIISQETIYGKVEAIVGNEVTLELGEPAEGVASRSEADSDGPEEETSLPAGNAAPEDGMSMPEGEMSMPEMDMPEGGMSMPEGGMGGGQASAAAGGRGVELEYTGETGTYLLPVGMSIGLSLIHI